MSFAQALGVLDLERTGGCLTSRSRSARGCWRSQAIGARLALLPAYGLSFRQRHMTRAVLTTTPFKLTALTRSALGTGRLALACRAGEVDDLDQPAHDADRDDDRDAR